MPSLRELQLRFAAALAGDPAAVAALTAPSPADAGRAQSRLAIYRANGRANYRNALAATYPVVRRLPGAAFFDAAVDAFVADEPPGGGDLNVYGSRFDVFLERYAPAANLPYLPDVARLEWAIDEANRAADAPRVPEAVLAALSLVAPARLPLVRLALDPSCRLVVSRFPVFRIWRANQPDRAGDERISLDEGGDALLVRRDPTGIVTQTLSAGEHAWLDALARRTTFGAAIDAALAADPRFDLGASLQLHVSTGTIAAVLDA
jgi:hypothetical protein